MTTEEPNTTRPGGGDWVPDSTAAPAAANASARRPGAPLPNGQDARPAAPVGAGLGASSEPVMAAGRDASTTGRDRPPGEQGGATSLDPSAEGSAVDGVETTTPGTGAPGAPGDGAGDTGGPHTHSARSRFRRQRRARSGRASFMRELPFLILVAFVLALIIKAFLVQVFWIPSGSMERTLLVNDRVLVNKVVYRFRDVHRGEVVVFNGDGTGFQRAEAVVQPPGNPVERVLRNLQNLLGLGAPSDKDFIKRVIGVGGDTVACCDRQGRVTVNGKGLDEPYVFDSGGGAGGTPFPATKVPNGQLWVMGDHRGDSLDSRNNGPIPEKKVIGRASVRIWPLSRLAILRVPDAFDNTPAGALGAPAALLGVVVVPGLLGRRRRGSTGRDSGPDLRRRRLATPVRRALGRRPAAASARSRTPLSFTAPGTGSDSEAGTDAGSDPDARTNAGSDSEAGTDADARANAGSDSEAGTDADARAYAGSESEAGTDADARANAGSDTEADADTGSGNRTDSGTDDGPRDPIAEPGPSRPRGAARRRRVRP